MFIHAYIYVYFLPCTYLSTHMYVVTNHTYMPIHIGTVHACTYVCAYVQYVVYYKLTTTYIRVCITVLCMCTVMCFCMESVYGFALSRFVLFVELVVCVHIVHTCLSSILPGSSGNASPACKYSFILSIYIRIYTRTYVHTYTHSCTFTYVYTLGMPDRLLCTYK